MYWTLADTTTSSQSGPGSNGNEGVLYIPQRSRTEASPSDCLVSYSGYSLLGPSYPSAEIQLAYSSVLLDKAAPAEHLDKNLKKKYPDITLN